MRKPTSYSPHVTALACLLILCCSLTAFAQSRMTVRSQVHHDVSAPLRDLIRATPHTSLPKHEAEPVRRIPLPPGLSAAAGADPVRQQTVVPLTPIVGNSFEGLGQGQYGFTVINAPPDTNGAVGAT